MRDLWENKSQLPNLCHTITSFKRYSQLPHIHQVSNDLLSSITDEDGKFAAGIAWYITEFYQIYEMEIN